MKKILIGALLVTSLTAPAFAVEPTAPLRNDLSADDAGVKHAGPGAEAAIVDEGGLTVVTPDDGGVVTGIPSGASSTSGTIIVDRSTEQLPSDAPTTPLRNDLNSDEAGVKGAEQPVTPKLPN
jgi:hypothetical protein